MATYNTINTDFTGGLMDPHLRGRMDLEKFNKGLQRIENFLPSIQGPVRFREGTQWIDDAQATGNVRLIDFSINNENRYLIGLSSQRINIYDRSGLLLYERTADTDDAALPWSNSEILDIRYSREVEKMIFTHKNHPPYELSANTVFDSIQLFSNDTYITSSASGDADATWDIVAATDPAEYEERGAGTMVIEYNSGAGQYQMLDATGGNIMYFVVASGTSESIPLSGWVTGDTGTDSTIAIEYGTYLTSNDNPVHALFAGSVGSAGLTPWAVSKVNFTSHPFQKIDTTDTVMKLTGETEVIKLVSSDGSDFASLPADLETTNKYVEYKAGNQWGLARLIDSNYTGGTFPDPTGTTAYAIPVDKVVNVNDPSTRVGFFNGIEADEPPPALPTWLDRDGVPDDEVHVRADSLTFKTSDIGAWVRVGGDKLFTNVVNRGGNFTDDHYNGQDGNVRWAKIIDYRGVEDHPVEFIEGTLDSDEFDSGSVYEVFEWDSGITDLLIYDGTGNNRKEGDLSAFVQKSGGSWRFAMNHEIWINAGTAVTASGSEVSQGTVYAGMLIANMSTQRQFDVAEVEASTVRVEGTDLLSPAGDISVYDLVTDPDGVATHTGALTASKDRFSAARDIGRFVFGKLLEKWVLMQIKEWTSDTTAIVDIFSSVPKDSLTGDITNDGVFTQFRMGAWYIGNWPLAVSYYEQRRVFGGSKNDPNLIWLSKLEDEADFRTVEDDGDVLDTSGITYQLGTDSTIIRWIESGPTMIIGTESNEWQLRPNEFSAAITPSNIRITQETPVGSILQGKRIGGSVFFPHISGRTLMEFKFDFQSQQFMVTTVTKLVPTLFESDPIKSMSYQLNPNATIWIITVGGQLFSLTYRKEDDYYAWAKHTTDGLFNEVAVLTKGDSGSSEDQVWFIVSRNGSQYMERLAPSFRDDGTDTYKKEAAFLDSHLRNPATGYLEAPATTVSVPARLESGGLARVVADGVDLGPLPVISGQVTLPTAATKYTLVGLPYTGTVQQNPYAFQTQGGFAYGQIKRIVSMRPYVYKSLGYKVGVAEDTVQQADSPNGSPDDSTTALYTGFMEEHGVINAQFGVDEAPLIKHDQPYPLTLVSNVQKIEVN